jgi:tetratricopeptide (TPR) repeat protein
MGSAQEDFLMNCSHGRTIVQSCCVVLGCVWICIFFFGLIRHVFPNGRNGCVSREPVDVEREREMGRAYIQQGKLSDAARCFTKVRAICPQNATARDLLEYTYLKMSEQFMSRGEYVEAAAILKKACAINSENGGIYLSLGWAHAEQKKYAQAEKYFKKAGLFPEYVTSSQHGLAQMYMAQSEQCRIHKQYARAQIHLLLALRIEPRNDLILRSLGWLYWEQRKFDAAERAMRAAVELNEQNESFYRTLADDLYDMGQYKCAERILRYFIERGQPMDVHIYHQLGNICLMQERYGDAAAFLTRALGQDDAQYAIQVNLARAYRGLKNYRKAEEILCEILRNDPSSAVCYEQMGWIAWERGAYEQAEGYFEEAVQRGMLTREAYVGLGWACQRQGKDVKALVAFTAAMNNT